LFGVIGGGAGGPGGGGTPLIGAAGGAAGAGKAAGRATTAVVHVAIQCSEDGVCATAETAIALTSVTVARTLRIVPPI
jgi:hypothetical protein